MKRIVILVAFAAMLVGMSSCKKSCTCTEKTTGVAVKYNQSEYDNMSCKDVQDILNKQSLIEIKCK